MEIRPEVVGFLSFCFVTTLTRQERLAGASAEPQDLEERASTVCCFCLWSSLKSQEAKQKPLLGSPASPAGDLWASVKCEDALKGVREFLWTLAAEPQSALQAREAFLVRGFVSAGFMGNGVLPFFLFGFLCLPALFAASEAWLIIFDGTNHYEALKEI